jgi:hypothetical protein
VKTAIAVSAGAFAFRSAEHARAWATVIVAAWLAGSGARAAIELPELAFLVAASVDPAAG